MDRKNYTKYQTIKLSADDDCTTPIQYGVDAYKPLSKQISSNQKPLLSRQISNDHKPLLSRQISNDHKTLLSRQISNDHKPLLSRQTSNNDRVFSDHSEHKVGLVRQMSNPASCGDDRYSDGYTYFPVVCPTCKGCGEIDEDVGSGMVTFVPVKDARLRPAWTKVKVVCMILFILSTGCVATYFLYPREVTIFVSAHEVTNFDFNRQFPWIQYSFTVNVKNQNFFDIKINAIVMQLLYAQIIVGRQTIDKPISVGMRSIGNHLVQMNITYDAANSGKYITKQCFRSRDYIPQLMVSSAELSYWMHSQHIESKDDYFYIDCDSMVFPLPTTTTTTTTTTKSTTVKPTTAKPTTTKPSTVKPITVKTSTTTNKPNTVFTEKNLL